jgi:hypothetical protein
VGKIVCAIGSASASCVNDFAHALRIARRDADPTPTLFCLKIVGDRLFSRYAGQQIVAADFVPAFVSD